MTTSDRSRILLILIVAINLINGVLLAILLPLWAGPDERAHYGYIQSLFIDRTLPDQRTCCLSEEIKTSTFEADWWRVSSDEGKIGPGADTFYCHGFSAFGNGGICAESRSRARSGQNSLVFGYDFTDERGEVLCAYRNKVDLTDFDGIRLSVFGDGSDVSLGITIVTSEGTEHDLGMPVVWHGWKDIVCRFDDFSSDLNAGLGRDMTLRIYVSDVNRPLDTLSGTVLVDDIAFSGPAGTVPLTGFEDEELAVLASDWPNWCAHHPPLYYFLMLPLEAALEGSCISTRVLAIRICSVILSTLTVWLMAFGARRLFGTSTNWWLLVPSLFVFSPVFSFDQACVNNDHLLIFLYTALLCLLVRWRDAPLSVGRIAALGAIVGAGLLSKLLFVTAIPLVFLFILLKEIGLSFRALRRVLMFASVFVFCTLAISGWWFLRNYSMFGGPIITGTTFAPDKAWPVMMGYWEIITSEHFLGWISVGWFIRIASHTNYVPTLVGYVLSLSLLGLAIPGIVKAFVVGIRGRRDGLGSHTARKLRLLFYAVSIHTFSVFMQIAQGSIKVGKFRAFNGRYLLPVGFGIAAIWAYGLSRLLPARARRYLVLGVILLLILIEFTNVHISLIKDCYPF